MPSPNPTVRREYAGAAAPTTLQSSIGTSDTSFTLVAANNWPTGATGVFTVTVDRGNPNEERILCSAQAAKVVTVSTRAYDGTSSFSHAAGAAVEVTLSGVEADEWNQHTHATSAAHGVAGSVVGTTDTQTLTNKTVDGGSNTLQNIPESAVTSLVSDLAAKVSATGTATLTNKTISGASNTISGPVSGVSRGPAWQGGGDLRPLDCTNATAGWSANLAVYLKFRCREAVTLTGLKVLVSGSAGNIDVGIYADSSGVPGAKVVTNGGVACPATGLQTVSIASTTLVEGTEYWLALAASSASAAFGAVSTAALSGAAVDVYQQQATAYPLPSSATPVAGTTERAILIGYTV